MDLVLKPVCPQAPDVEDGGERRSASALSRVPSHDVPSPVSKPARTHHACACDTLVGSFFLTFDNAYTF
jgi:hypothetical protein